MLVLQQVATAQTFKIIPRAYAADSMIITDETTKDSITYAITITQLDYYAVISKIITLVEGHTYTLTVLDGANVVYKDKIFCTNQSATTYTINNGEYVQNTTDNEFIVYE
jgi:hypothetical protein